MYWYLELIKWGGISDSPAPRALNNSPGCKRRLSRLFLMWWLLCPVSVTGQVLQFSGGDSFVVGVARSSFCPPGQWAVGFQFQTEEHQLSQTDLLCTGINAAGEWDREPSTAYRHVLCPRDSFAYSASTRLSGYINALRLRCRPGMPSPGTNQTSPTQWAGSTTDGEEVDWQDCPDRGLISEVGGIFSANSFYDTLYFICGASPGAAERGADLPEPDIRLIAQPVFSSTVSDAATTITLSPDGRALITTTGNMGVLWALDVSAASPVRIRAVMPGSHPAVFAGFTPDSRKAVIITQAESTSTHTNTIHYRDLHNIRWQNNRMQPEELAQISEVTFRRPPAVAVFSGDGRRMISYYSSGDKGNVIILNSSESVAQSGHLEPLYALFHRDLNPGIISVNAATGLLLTASYRSLTQLWDLNQSFINNEGVPQIPLYATLQERSTTPRNPANSRLWHFAVFSANGEFVAAACDRGHGKLWRLSEAPYMDDQGRPGVMVEARLYPAGVIRELGFSAGGHYLMAGLIGEPFGKVWNTRQLKTDTQTGFTVPELKAVTPHTGDITSVCFHPFEDQLVVTGSEDGTAILWDLNTISEQEGYDPVAEALLRMPHGAALKSIYFHPEGRHLVTLTESGSWFIWDITGFVTPVRD